MLGLGTVTVGRGVLLLFELVPQLVWLSWCLYSVLANSLLPVLTHLAFVLKVVEMAETILLSVLEGSNEDVAVWVIYGSWSVHLALLKSTIIVGSILEEHTSLDESVVLECTFLSHFGLSIVELTLSMEFTIKEISLIDIAIVVKSSESSLNSLVKGTRILESSVFPGLDTLAVLGVADPVSIKGGSGGHLHESTFSIGSTICPCSLVNVAIWVGHSSLSIELIIVSLSLVESSIGVFDLTDSFPVLVLLLLSLTSVLSGALWITLLRNVLPVVVPNKLFIVNLEEVIVFHEFRLGVWIHSELSIDEAWLWETDNLLDLVSLHLHNLYSGMSTK